MYYDFLDDFFTKSLTKTKANMKNLLATYALNRSKIFLGIISRYGTWCEYANTLDRLINNAYFNNKAITIRAPMLFRRKVFYRVQGSHNGCLLFSVLSKALSSLNKGPRADDAQKK